VATLLRVTRFLFTVAKILQDFSYSAYKGSTLHPRIKISSIGSPIFNIIKKGRDKVAEHQI
jgi:hypothetical protein